MNINSISSLSDEQLLCDAEAAAKHERSATVELIALLAEMDARRLYLKQGYSSMFVYCTRCLHLSEHAAYGRIEAARAARKFPIILERLADGSITLTTVCLLSNHLTADNHQQLLAAAMQKSRREVEEQVAALRPMSAVPSAIRRLPQAPRATSNTLGKRSWSRCPFLSRVHQPRQQRSSRSRCGRLNRQSYVRSHRNDIRCNSLSARIHIASSGAPGLDASRVLGREPRRHFRLCDQAVASRHRTPKVCKCSATRVNAQCCECDRPPCAGDSET